jgi:hypothetical protein
MANHFVAVVDVIKGDRVPRNPNDLRKEIYFRRGAQRIAGERP